MRTFESSCHSGIDPIGRGINLSRVLENFAAQLPIDNSRVIVVVIENDRGSTDEEEKKDRKKDFEERRSKEI